MALSDKFDVGYSQFGGSYRAYCWECQQSLVGWEDKHELDAWKKRHAHPEVETGCYIAGHHGIYAIYDMIRLAEKLGWEYLESHYDDEDLVKAYEEGNTGENGYEIASEAVSDIADKAENWLNENVAPDGQSFGWYEGEFYLQETEWWEEA